ncbi:ABATE domain-containing protein [Streptomyces sp. B1I3]|uniref:CGNR zinc finger domain-containing protein n=1 Tax=Streptomyces sp. B1I3 TaxID=3042264 RepID=UPI00278364E6|nr:ABATE domain-containing protein [Streptomyces sp. B1I3]MDQ0794204.1 putative RNA-binding Zn ribbon-like protein [Streptomyces sp. B1I3]
MNFAFVSGSVALDFVGTVQSRRDAPLDLLTTTAQLSEWTASSGILDAATTATRGDLASAVRLREAIYRLMLAAADHSAYPPEDCATVNRAATPNPVRTELRPDGTVRHHGTVGAVLSTVARDAIQLMTDTPQLVKECAAPRCTRLYVDRSHRGSRRWCDMTRCGNRAKAALYRSRHA